VTPSLNPQSIDLPGLDDLECRTGRRRDLLRRRGINGIDAVEVADDGVTLTVYFLTGVPHRLEPGNVRLEGGVGPAPRAVSVGPGPVDPGGDPSDSVDVVVDRVGGPGTYRLRLVRLEGGRPTDAPLPGLDPRYASAEFAFTQICPTDLDCAGAADTPPAVPEAGAPRDYLARDYATFRRLLLDRMALVAPAWRERRIPDLGVTLVELLAYVGDHLAYYQDAVATEAYLDTARQRISVRRHGRLVDHVLGEGANARAFVVVAVDAEIRLRAADVGFVTGWPEAPPGGLALPRSRVDALAPGTAEEYRPLCPGDEEIVLRPGHDRIAIHTWGDDLCRLPAGATVATLVDDPRQPLALACGDLLLLEEVRGPVTGFPGDADPHHRHVVRLTRVDRGRDEATGTDVVAVRWDPDDALPFPLTLSSLGPAPGCAVLPGVSVARGNVVPVDHGRWVDEHLPAVPAGPSPQECEGPCRPADASPRAGRFRPRLAAPGLTHAEPFPPGLVCDCGDVHGPTATALLARDPSAATPVLALYEPPGPHDRPGSRGRRWTAVPDLLASGPDDRHVVVEMDDDRVANLRFGDDRSGEEPEPGTVFRARYRVGNGSAGNVGAEAIRYLVLPDGVHPGSAVFVRNPCPASGGADPESLADAKQVIPAAFRVGRERAVTADDYAELAARIGGDAVQAATADLVWTGSGYVAEVALDPRVGGRPRPPDPRLGRRVEAALQHYRRMGHDVVVVAADLVPIDLEVTVCVDPYAVAAHVKADLLDLLGAGLRRDGTPGLFHPDRWTFGRSVDASPITAAAAAVPGVTAAEVTRLARVDVPGSDAAKAGVLRIGRHEIAQLDPGPDRARGGLLTVTTIGGR
jgi:Baseplate J-like protein